MTKDKKLFPIENGYCFYDKQGDIKENIFNRKFKTFRFVVNRKVEKYQHEWASIIIFRPFRSLLHR